ncbi:MAG: hypothetical protein ACKVK6_16230, partial [bacterium]
ASLASNGTEPRMKKRIASLSCILSLTFQSKPQTTAEHETLISDWLHETSTNRGISRHTLRRDLIYSNGYKGTGATQAFASDVWDAVLGEPRNLLTQIKARKDEPALRDLLDTFTTAPMTSAEWIEQHVRENDLDGHLTNILKRKSYEEYAEIRSFVGLWLATWGHRGTFDEVIAKHGFVRIGILVRFLKGKLRSDRYQRGCEPIHRMYGARTEHEIKMRQEMGDSDYISKNAENVSGLPSDGVYIFRSDEGDEPKAHFVFTSPQNTEINLIHQKEKEQRLKAFKTQLRKAHPKAHERYLRIFDRMVEGQNRTDIAAEEGISTKRAGVLTGEIRAELRKGMLDRGQASKVLALVEHSPRMTREDTEEDTTVDARPHNASGAFSTKA